jgi:hypothetical protein
LCEWLPAPCACEDEDAGDDEADEEECFPLPFVGDDVDDAGDDEDDDT